MNNFLNISDHSSIELRAIIDEAKARLQEGPGSLTNKVQKMKDIGRLATKKKLPDDSL